MLLPYHEVHEGRGPPLLLVHGMLSSRAHWTPNLERLRQVSTPVLVELYGHGRSPAPEERAAYRPEAYVEAFERIREVLGVERWFLLGQSLGATLTLRYALDRPERVQGHVMTNSMSAFADEVWVERLRADMARVEASVAKHGRAALERLAVHPANAKRLDPVVRELLLADAALHDPVGVARCGAETATCSQLARLGENRVPTLLVHGTREARFAEAAARATARMPGLEVLALDVGHGVNLDAPAEFDRAVAAFIGRLCA